MVAVLAIPLVLSACSGGNSDEVPLSELAGASALVYCAKVFECCTDEEMEAFTFTNMLECRTQVTVGLEDYMVSPMQAAVATGRGEYNGQNALACLEAVRDLGCVGTNNPAEFFDHCQSPWTALQTDGQPCASIFECGGGTYCSKDTSHCVTPAAENQACTPKQDPYCEAQLYCDGTTCLMRKPENADCTEDLECALGTECTMGICTAKELSCTGKP
jgi:hypothetical protein